MAAYSFMIFNLLCAPCFAAMGAIKREMNVILAVRSLRKSRKSGGGCNGDCGNCRGCH